MTETSINTYEGMFLLDSTAADFNTSSEAITTVLARSEAEILSMTPWDDRRLAYEIKKKTRGLYVLTYFKADAEKITDIERDCQLNETILRLMILKRDNLSEEELKTETPAQVEQRQIAESAAARAAAEAKAEEAAAEAAAAEAAEAAPEATPEAAPAEAPAVEEAPAAEAAVETPAEAPADAPAAEEAPAPAETVADDAADGDK